MRYKSQEEAAKISMSSSSMSAIALELFSLLSFESCISSSKGRTRVMEETIGGLLFRFDDGEVVFLLVLVSSSSSSSSSSTHTATILLSSSLTFIVGVSRKSWNRHRPNVYGSDSMCEMSSRSSSSFLFSVTAMSKFRNGLPEIPTPNAFT